MLSFRVSGHVSHEECVRLRYHFVPHFQVKIPSIILKDIQMCLALSDFGGRHVLLSCVLDVGQR